MSYFEKEMDQCVNTDPFQNTPSASVIVSHSDREEPNISGVVLPLTRHQREAARAQAALTHEQALELAHKEQEAKREIERQEAVAQARKDAIAAKAADLEKQLKDQAKFLRVKSMFAEKFAAEITQAYVDCLEENYCEATRVTQMLDWLDPNTYFDWKRYSSQARACRYSQRGSGVYEKNLRVQSWLRALVTNEYEAAVGYYVAQEVTDLTTQVKEKEKQKAAIVKELVDKREATIQAQMAALLNGEQE